MRQAMTKEQYEAWAQHPQTKQYHQYLKDYRLGLMEAWAKGALKEPGMEEMAMARCQMVDDLVTMDSDWIADFYKNQPKEEVSDVSTD